MTLVTGTIRDPAGNPYTSAIIVASFIGQNTTPGAGPYVTGGVPQGQFETIVPGMADSFGAFSMPLAGNDTITPSPSQWKFTVVSNTTPAVSFAVLITITGGSQDISAALQAAAAPLNPSVGFGNINVTGITDTGSLNVSGNAAMTGTLGITRPGVFTDTQLNQSSTSNVNSINFTTEFQNAEGNHGTTEAISGGVNVPAGATVLQAEGVGGFVVNASPTTFGFGGYFQCRGTANNTKNGGINPVVLDTVGLTTGISLYGSDLVAAPRNANTAYNIVVGYSSSLAAPANAQGYGQAFDASSQSSAFWNFAFRSRDGAAAVAMIAGALGTSGTTNSQSIAFTFMVAGVPTTTSILIDSSNLFRTDQAAAIVANYLRNLGAISNTGFIRMVKTDTVVWRNNANSADIPLGINGSDLPVFNGSVIPTEVGVTSQKAETAADTNVLTFSPPAVVGSYRLRFVMAVSAANAATLGWTATWTDSNGNAQTPTNLALTQVGTAAPALTFTTSAAGNYHGSANIDINAAGANIVIKLTFSGTSFTAKVTATVERIV